ncbi:MAG: glucose 1-dehydrogenase [Candidatus Rokubacteria bacterium]|nr:glucose 1-dehydrogenase [Candidatus Rokubacteria bacterium]
MRLDFTGKVVIVTGASRGIGEAVATAFARAGATLALTARHLDGLEAVCGRLATAGATASAHALDVADVTASEALVDALVARHGRIDVLVNNAGTNVRQAAGQVTPEVWDRIFATNTRGLFFLSQAVGRTMAARGGGAIVNIGSVAQAVGRREMVAYAASKAGVAQITRTLALEWARHGVRVNAVAPGYVRTPLVEPVFQRADLMQEILDRTPLRRVAEPSEIAGPVLFLASEAASYVTGHTLFVDGGWTAG